MDLSVPDFEKTVESYYATCPCTGRQKLHESGCYVDPWMENGVRTGWGLSCFVYRCPLCEKVLAIRDNLEWFGEPGKETPSPALKYYNEGDVKTLERIISGEY